MQALYYYLALFRSDEKTWRSGLNDQFINMFRTQGYDQGSCN